MNFNNKAGVTFKSIIESLNVVQLFEAISITVKQYNSAHPLQIAQKELHQYFSKSQGHKDFDVYFEEVIEHQRTAKMMNGKIISEVFAVHAIEMLKQDLPADPKVANVIKRMEATFTAFCTADDATFEAILKKQDELLLMMQAIGGANDKSPLHSANALTTKMGDSGNVIPKSREQLCSPPRMKVQFVHGRYEPRSIDSRSSRRNRRCKSKVAGNIITVQPPKPTIQVQQKKPWTPTNVIKPSEDDNLEKGQNKTTTAVSFQSDNDNDKKCINEEKKDVKCFGCGKVGFTTNTCPNKKCVEKRRQKANNKVTNNASERNKRACMTLSTLYIPDTEASEEGVDDKEYKLDMQRACFCKLKANQLQTNSDMSSIESSGTYSNTSGYDGGTIGEDTIIGDIDCPTFTDSGNECAILFEIEILPEENTYRTEDTSQSDFQNGRV